MKCDADVSGAPGGASNRLTEKATRELEHLGARNNEEDEPSHQRREEFLLLLFAVATASAIFKEAHL